MSGKRKVSAAGRKLSIVGPDGSTMLDATLANATTLDDLVVAFKSNRWRIDNADGQSVAGPSGVWDPVTAASEDAATED